MTAVVLTGLALTGCVTSLNPIEQREYQMYKERGMLIREKSPGVGVALGFFLGCGSHYTRNYGCGVAGLIYPPSILWDPFNGYNGAVKINYHTTKAYATARMNKEIRALDDELFLETITKEEYIRRKRLIELKYTGGL